MKEITPGLPKVLRVYIVLVGIAGMALLAHLAQRVEWEPSTLGEMGLFVLLIVLAGSFLLHVGPRVKTDVSTAALFGAALLLEPGAAALAGVVGVVTYTFLVRFWGEKVRVPWYKYPFNAGATALYVGLTSVVFHALSAGEGLLTLAIVPAAAICYLANTSLVSVAAGLHMGFNPLRFWWMGTRENGPVELSLFAFGLLGAMVYRESAWSVVVLFIPVAIIYFAFSRLARKITELKWAEEELQKAKDDLEIRVQERTSELANATEQLTRSRRRVVNAQEELRKGVAQQLHGPVQNRLLVATQWLHMAQASMSTDVATAAEHITRTAHLLDEINQREIRSVVQRLHPSLIRMSLQASLRSLADQFHKSFYVELHFDVSDPSKEELWQGGLPEELRLAIYRVAEEALSNVLKHAKANRVALRLDNPSADRVMMTIQDNGCGFDVKATPPGFGILSMQDYCGAVGGTLEIKSNTGEITTIVASFPIPSETEALPLSVTEVPKEAAYVLSSNGNGNGNGKKSAALRRAMYQGNEAVTTLVVADDEPEFCGLVADLLRPYKEFQIVAESHDGRTAISLVEELHPDVVLLDVEMPGLHGLEATKEIHSRFPDVKVVLMSAHHQREYIEEALPSGASDFINKAEFSVNRLRQACQRKTESKTQPVYEVALR